jgi:hypothetical protein
MARRRKPISFDLLISGDKDELVRVIDDLRKKRPCGPQQDLHAEDYENYYGNDAHLNDSIQEKRKVRREGGGYTNYQLYTIAKVLGCEGSYVNDWTIRNAISEKVYGYALSAAARTRRTNRLTERLRGGYRDAIRNGDVGDSVFGVYMRSTADDRSDQDYQVQVVARSDDEAETIASTLFGYALGEVSSTDFIREGTASDTMKQNEKARQKTVSHIEGKRNMITKLQAEITDLEAAGEAISMYSISAFSGGEDASVDI